MKILILSSIRLDSGTGLRLIGLAESLAKLGHEVYLAGYGLNEKIKYAKYLEIKNARGVGKYFISMISNIGFSRRLKYDVVIASKAHPVSCIPALFAKTKTKILDFDDLEHAYWKNPIKIAILKTSERFFPRFFDYITTHNDNLKIYISRNIGIPEDKIIFLPQAIMSDILKNRPGKTGGISDKLGLKNKKVVVYAAHLGVAAPDLEMVFSTIKKIGSDVRLLVIGSGEKLEHYKELAKSMDIEDHVIFVGYVKHEDIPKYLSIANAAINFMEETPANVSRASIKVREYLAFGLPTVCNIFGPDLKNFRNFVYEFETNGEESLKNALVKAIENRDKKAGKAEKYMEKFYWDNVSKDFERSLEKIVRS